MLFTWFLSCLGRRRSESHHRAGSVISDTASVLLCASAQVH